MRGGSIIEGATNLSYVLTSLDIGKKITVTVTTSSSNQTSWPTDTILGCPAYTLYQKGGMRTHGDWIERSVKSTAACAVLCSLTKKGEKGEVKWCNSFEYRAENETCHLYDLYEEGQFPTEEYSEPSDIFCIFPDTLQLQNTKGNDSISHFTGTYTHALTQNKDGTALSLVWVAGENGENGLIYVPQGDQADCWYAAKKRSSTKHKTMWRCSFGV